MWQKTVPILSVVAVVLAVITARVMGMPFRKDSFSLALVLAYLLAEMVLAWFAAALLRRKRLHHWLPAEGTLESCNPDSVSKGIQTYCCAYVFRPDDTRQGGTFLISEQASDSDDRLDEIRKQLIGYTVRVRFDPNDYTRSMVENKQIAEWQVETD